MLSNAWQQELDLLHGVKGSSGELMIAGCILIIGMMH